MLSRSLRLYSSISKDLSSKMSEVQARINKLVPPSTYEGTSYSVPEESAQKTLDERLAELDRNVAKIEALREAGRPEEIRIRNLPMKFGRAGRHPAYPWYGEAVEPKDRIPYLADRLGKYSEITPTQTHLNDWFQFKSDLHNPLFNSFFVQPPTLEPDPDVNFEKGEIIYENPDAFQGVALSKQVGWTSLFYVAFHMFHTAMCGRTIYPMANEGMDHRADYYNPGQGYLSAIHSSGAYDWHDTETFATVAFIGPIAPMATAAAVGLIKHLTDGVATRLQFNKDKDLIFVTKVKGVYRPKEYEEVYETTHLQVLPPAVRTGFENVATREVFTINCMNSHESFRVSSNKKYWNPKLYDEVQDHLYGLWGP